MNFDDLKKHLDNIDKNLIPSCRIKVYKNHKELFSYFTASESARSDENKEFYFMYSMSKPILACASMQLIERGIISLNDKVSKYLPEFENLYVGSDRRPAKNPLTVFDLLTMQGGYNYDIRTVKDILEIKEKTDNKATTRQVVSVFAKRSLSFEPGTDYQYSLCHDIMAAVIEVATGKTYFEYLSENIFKPLEMNNTFLRISDDIKNRMHTQYIVNQLSNIAEETEKTCGFVPTENYESAGAGIISTIDDYAKFADNLACTPDNEFSLLKPETLDLMTKNHLCKKALETFRKSYKYTFYGYGLGVRVYTDKDKNNLSSLGEFGWDGAAGSYVLMDPKEKLSIVYTQHVTNCKYAYEYIHPMIRNAVYSIIK